MGVRGQLARVNSLLSPYGFQHQAHCCQAWRQVSWPIKPLPYFSDTWLTELNLESTDLARLVGLSASSAQDWRCAVLYAENANPGPHNCLQAPHHLRYLCSSSIRFFKVVLTSSQLRQEGWVWGTPVVQTQVPVSKTTKMNNNNNRKCVHKHTHTPEKKNKERKKKKRGHRESWHLPLTRCRRALAGQARLLPFVRLMPRLAFGCSLWPWVEGDLCPNRCGWFTVPLLYTQHGYAFLLQVWNTCWAGDALHAHPH